MRDKIFNCGCTMAVCLLLAGCDTFLGHEPDDRLKINTLERVAQTVTGAYNDFGVRFTDISSDNAGLVDGVYYTEIPMEDLYTWNRDIRNQEHQDSPGGYWIYAYRAVSNVNIALEALEALEPEEKESARAGAIRGEALILRSYYHFMLVNIFAPHYDALTAATTPGVPYVKEVETKLIVDYPRASVEEVYRQAEADLLEGIRLVEANKGEFSNNKYHFTFPTVYLYASRFYLFRNRDNADVEAAIDFSEKSMASFGGTGVMRNWLDYATDNYGPVDINQPEVGMVQSSSTWTVYQYAYQLTLPIKYRDLKNPFNFKDTRQEIVYKGSGNIFMPAFYYVMNPNGSSTAIDIFPFSEALLNAAESYARHHDYDKAIDLMRTFGSRVYDSYEPGKVTVDWLTKYYAHLDEENKEELALIEYILFERRVHFLFHGMRWFDIRRYEFEVEHTLLNGETLYLSDIAPNREYQIPRFAIEAGMTPNK